MASSRWHESYLTAEAGMGSWEVCPHEWGHGSLSIFQSKDDPEIGFRFQYKVILKSEEAAAQRPVSFLGFWF
jgi:hypothetical protein